MIRAVRPAWLGSEVVADRESRPRGRGRRALAVSPARGSLDRDEIRQREAEVDTVVGEFGHFDPFAAAMLADPYPLFAAARRHAPVVYAEAIDHWVVTRREDIKAVLLDPATYSARNTIQPVLPLSEEAQRILREGDWRISPALGNNDPPDHTRFRTAVNQAFTARRVAAMEPIVRRIVDESLDAVHTRGRAELMGEMLHDLPATVILEMLGIPADDIPIIRRGSSNRILFVWGRPTPAQQAELARGMVDFWRYLRGLVDDRSASPRDDLTSALLGIRDGDDAVLSLDEIASVLFAFLTAGHETTSYLLGNAVRTLLEHPDQYAALVADPDRISQAVEEVLRFDSPVVSWRRQATTDTTIGGHPIPAGAQLLLLLGSANHDEQTFDDPDTFDIARANARAHLSFGHGIHFCLGAPLARLEARVALERITAVLPSLRLIEDQQIRTLPNTSFRGPLELHVAWDVGRTEPADRALHNDYEAHKV
jgi:cytochrome P450